jgi:hypothetical protein
MGILWPNHPCSFRLLFPATIPQEIFIQTKQFVKRLFACSGSFWHLPCFDAGQSPMAFGKRPLERQRTKNQPTRTGGMK